MKNTKEGTRNEEHKSSEKEEKMEMENEGNVYMK